ncbi:MAG: hypothetical protein JWP97_3083 [Labilithrix sp.]|nr:hypothetical protein [Labilithrix sp.]
MSSSHGNHDASYDDSELDHDASDHAHHGPPAPPEPKTPLWLPAVGAALFLAAGLWWALSGGAPLPHDAAQAAHAGQSADGGH